MALVNYSAIGFGGAGALSGGVSVAVPMSPPQAPFDDLLYSPADHQPEQAEAPHRNDPYAPPVQRRVKLRKRSGTAYLPPPNQFTHYPREDAAYAPRTQLHTRVFQQTRLSQQTTYDNTGQYVHDPSGDYDYEQRRINTPGYLDAPYAPRAPSEPAPAPALGPSFGPPPTPVPTVSTSTSAPTDRPPGFTKVEQGGSNGKTQLHAVLDYDEDYYDDIPGPGATQGAVTPLQGPILLRNGTVPVVPLTSYPTVNNGSFYQIPILWTALSLALGYELQGQIIKGVPCVKRNYQLYCPTAGNTYPLDKIETFIDENKALIKRMYGSFATPGAGRVRRAPGVPDLHAGDSYFRHARQASTQLPDPQTTNSTGRIDACESKTDITTPYWALNSARKVRAIVNTMHFEQAIHQEVCSKTTTSRCSGDCGCEQKYKWHRLLAYDPSDDCAGIFMDWFLFPSCCVCRCNP